MPYTYSAPSLPRAFILRRAHSLTGLFLVLFLIEHLLTNSQAALFVGENGKGFIHAVNFLQNLPYLPVLEIILLGVPFFIHGYWGICYLFTGKYNSFATDGSTPSLPQYTRNQAYTWQRITAWILVVGVIAHVVHMRFFLQPQTAQVNTEYYFMTPVSEDTGLYPLSQRLGFTLYNQQEIEEWKQALEQLKEPLLHQTKNLAAMQQGKEQQHLLQIIDKYQLNSRNLLAVAPNFGMALLLIVRDTFKSPWMIMLYTCFVLSSTFHACNGLWTFMITWGVTLTARSQLIMRYIATALFMLLSFLGLASIWGSYWLNRMQ